MKSRDNLPLTIKDRNTINTIKWSEFVKNHQYGSIFHTPEMFDVFNSTPFYEPFALFCVDEDDTIQSMLMGYVQTVKSGLLSALSKRVVIPHSPICYSEEALILLLEEYHKSIAKKAIYTEIRNHYDTKQCLPAYEKLGFHYVDHLNILIDLSKPEDVLLKDMSSPRRREIKRAGKENYIIRPIEKEELQVFYSIINEIYVRAKLPLVSIEFFQSVVEKIPASKLIGIYLENELIGGVLAISYKDVMYGLYGGSKSSYFKKRPNDYLFWSLILISKEGGNSIFDWMGAGHPDKPYGVRDWKKQFGGNFVSYGRYKSIHSKLKMNVAEKGFNFLRKIKDKI